MTYKTLLVHAEPGPGADTRLKLAIGVAHMFRSKVIGLGAEACYPVVASGYGATDAMVIEATREQIAADLVKAKARFERTMAAAGDLESSWLVGYDLPATELARHAGAADMVIASRPVRGARPADTPNAASLVLTAGVPVLFVGATDKPLEASRVLVAWKNTRECRRALSDALPFLMRAEKVALAAVEGEAQPADRSVLEAVAARLARHGVDVEIQTLTKGRRAVAEALEMAAGRFGADLVVMGAYGHSRLQEWVLGGATEDTLVDSSKYVLFSH
ncbi:MAG TPA: universal stress protein [Caulobacteraceae bacterium]|jgi:nucleotide-binding universal stress UspA family protein|nr:universal stress protein [Caulobacteraceae bacterium]